MVDAVDRLRIWKLSHGVNSFTRDEREKYLQEQVIAIYAGYEQGNTFKRKMRKGDWFYLCHGNKGKDNGIQLLGRLASSAEPFKRHGSGWWKRKYRLETWRIKRDGHLNDKRPWAPGGNSTCWAVPQEELPDFEKKILKPHFNMRLRDLLDRAKTITAPISPMPLSFSPEFSGRKSYTTRGQVKSVCNHGVVVSALAADLRKRGLDPANDKPRDLYVSSNGRMVVLFEAKTDTSTTSIYEGIGQLMFHGAAEPTPPKRVLVLPNAPNSQTGTALKRVGVSVVHYRWKGEALTFKGIDEVLR